MSKPLKKLIDINRLREFKNKLVGTDSPYVQTGAVDQTVAGTKTFSKPIVGSVTGSSGSCTGNAATATTAGAVSTSVANGSVKDLVYASMAGSDQCRIRCGGGSDAGYLEIATADNGNEPIYVRQNDNTHGSVRTLTLLDGNGNTQLPGTVTAPTFSGNLNGNAATATKLATARTIALSGAATGTATAFDGSGNITIPVTSLDASKLTGTASVSTTGNAATATKLAAARSLWGNNFDGSAAITGPITGPSAIELIPKTTTMNNGGFLDFHYNQSTADYTSRIIESASGTLSINNVTITTGKVVTAATFNGALKGNVTGNCSGSSGSCTGNAATATQFSANATVALTGDATGTSAGSKKGWSVPVTLANSGVTAGTYGPSADVTGNNNATISVPQITVDTKGRVTSVVNRTLTCKNNTYTVNNATLTIQKNGTNVATFTSNASSNATANITVPTKTSELTNDSGFLTSHQSLSNYVTLNGTQTISGAKTFNSPINSPVTTGHWIDGNRGVAIINSTANAGYNVLFRMKSSHGVFTGCAYDQSYQINYTTDSIVNAGTNATTYTNTLIDENGNATFSNNITVRGTVNGNLNGNVTGNAATATKLQTARTINGTSFDGSANITTANWGTARNITITDGTNTSTAVSVNGSADVALTLPATIKANLTGNCSGSSGSCTGNAATATTATTAKACTGNAATATKLATARTIALSGAATGTATGFDGSGNITIPVTALAASAIRAQWYAAFPDGAEAHNAMWGGRNITAAFNNGTVSANIKNGTFKDIFPGDYITKQVTISGTAYTVNWVIADCDYWINKGDTAMTAHHVVIVPQQPIFTARMHDTNTIEGGYAGSEMYTHVIPPCAKGLVNAFGSDHILTFRDAIPDKVKTSYVSSGIPQWTGTSGWFGVWVSVQCNLMSEKMVYGAPICAAGAMDNVMATRQMSAFRLSERLINYNKQNYWLRDVVSSTNFAAVGGGGYANTGAASTVRGVRPFALLK